MHFRRRLLPLLIVFDVLGTASALAIPPRLQALFALDAQAGIGKHPSSGLDFYRRAVAARRNQALTPRIGGLKPGMEHGSKAKPPAAGFLLHSTATADKSHIFVSRHEHRRDISHNSHSASGFRLARSIAESATAILQGLPGTIDIVSPTADSEVGEKLASLSVSTQQSALNEFILNATGANVTTVYLVVKSTSPISDSSLAVALQIPVFDTARASYIPYCATFDTSQPSPLTAMECTEDGSGLSDRNSQLFSYNSTSGVIKPLWLASTPISESGTQQTSTEKVGTSMSDPQSPLETLQGTDTNATTSMSSSPQSVSLVFTPEIDPSVPVVNSQASQAPAADTSATSTSEVSSPTAATADTSTGSGYSLRPTEAEVPSSTSISMPVEMPSQSAAAPDPTAAVGASIEGPTDNPTTSSVDEPTTSSSSDSSAPTGNPAVSRRMDPDEDASGGNGVEEDGEEDGTEDSALPESSGADDASLQSVQEVDTGYAWRFSPSV